MHQRQLCTTYVRRYNSDVFSMALLYSHPSFAAFYWKHLHPNPGRTQDACYLFLRPTTSTQSDLLTSSHTTLTVTDCTLLLCYDVPCIASVAHFTICAILSVTAHPLSLRSIWTVALLSCVQCFYYVHYLLSSGNVVLESRLGTFSAYRKIDCTAALPSSSPYSTLYAEANTVDHTVHMQTPLDARTLHAQGPSKDWAH